MTKISGGYYIKARCIKNSSIANAPPYVREIWDYLLREANHKDKKYSGYIIKRGQLFRSYRDIRDDLCWKVGYRTERYNENQMKMGMRYLMKQLMITVAKQPRGNIITVCNYDYYQNPKNYDTTSDTTSEATNAQPMPNQGVLSINKNVKNEKNEKNKKRVSSTKENKDLLVVFEKWNSLKIIQHRNFTKLKPIINASLQNYKLDEIISAIDNYATVFFGDKYFWTYRWGLKEILQCGLDRFIPVNFRENDYLSKDNNKPRATTVFQKHMQEQDELYGELNRRREARKNAGTGDSAGTDNRAKRQLPGTETSKAIKDDG